MEGVEHKKWWNYIGGDIQRLFLTSKFLLKTLENWRIDLPDSNKSLALEKLEFGDYAFVLFPVAKAYEGFLKKLFLELGFITEKEYTGKYFRIGKSLNPSLPKEIRQNEVYDKIVRYYGDSHLADHLWDAWRVGRNLTFHWFPDEKNAITLLEAKERIELILSAIDEAFEAGNLDFNS